MAFAHTKCDYIMCARGAKANPSLFSHLASYWKNPLQPRKPEKLYGKTTEESRKDFFDFLDLYRKREERFEFSELRDHALWTATECVGNKRITQEILASTSVEQLSSIFSAMRFAP